MQFVSGSNLVLISFWMLTMPWILCPTSFYRRVSRFVVFQTLVAHSCFIFALLFHILLCSHKNAVAHNIMDRDGNFKKCAPTGTGTKI